MSKQSRKGIILAGGSGTRLYPLTKGISKQLLPVFDKPMIYYPLSVLMLANIKDILIISTSFDTPIIEKIFGNGSNLGLNISYEVQEQPNGIGEAFLIGESFINNSPVTLILGDNLIFGQDFTSILNAALSNSIGATIFGYRVQNPENFGVIEFDEHKNVISIEEKPKEPKSQYAIPGLYFYDERVCDIAKNLSPSARGELEITDINKVYLDEKNLHMELFGRGTAWLDMGTNTSLHRASMHIESMQKIQSYQIGNIEEIAYRREWISKAQLIESINSMGNNDYSKYLKNIINDLGHKNPNICVD